MLENDWIMKRINEIVMMIAKILFNKNTTDYNYKNVNEKASVDLIYDEIIRLFKDKNLNGAENLLFEKLNEEDLKYLEIAVDFYSKLNELSNKELEEMNFSRAEIKEGFEEILNIYNVNFSLK